MKVVFDTNILVSALALPGGQADLAMERLLSGEDQLVISHATLDELLEVLARKFSHEPEELARLAVYLGDLGEVVEPMTRLEVLADEPDNRFLECADAGGAALIVTGDQAMLDLGRHREVRIVSLRQYLEREISGA